MKRIGDVCTSSRRHPPRMQLLVVSPGTREYRHYFGSPSRQIGSSFKGRTPPKTRLNREAWNEARPRRSLREKCFTNPKTSYLNTNEVLVSHVISPDEIYVQHTCSMESLQIMMEEIQTSAVNCKSISVPLTGMSCLAKWPYDECYYRCRITDVTESDTGVHFVDYGDEIRVNRSQNACKVIDAAFSCRPFFAYKVKLADVTPRSQRGMWEEETKQKLINFFDKKSNVFIMEVVEDVMDSVKVVKLKCPDGKDLSWHFFQLGIVDLIKKMPLDYMIQNDNVGEPQKEDSNDKLPQIENVGIVQNKSEDLVRENGYSPHEGATDNLRPIDTRKAPNLDVLTSESMMPVNVTAPAEDSLSTECSGMEISQTMLDVPVATKKEVVCISLDESEDEENVETDKEIESYVDYVAVKIEGARHPNPIVETTSLASVNSPDIWYKLSLPKKCIDSGALSAMQLEAITHASQRHERKLPDGSRAGYLVGDGAGVGKGRIAAGIIFENYQQGRYKAIWISSSNDLKNDAERDLQDIGAREIAVHALNKLKYQNVSTGDTCSSEIPEKGVLFCAYSNLIGVSRSAETSLTRLDQLSKWFHEDFDGVIIFDECHNEGKALAISKISKTDLAVSVLQKKLPNARVVYISSTGFSEPRKMAYMVRLGLWGQGTSLREFSSFVLAVEKSKANDVEVMVRKMKQCGMYIARQLSYKGANVKIKEVVLSPKLAKVYGNSIKLWTEFRKCFAEVADLVNAQPRERQTMWTQFWLAHQRFFKCLCISAKVSYAVKIASEAVRCGKCVVIGLHSTAEARTLEQTNSQGELSEFVSPTKRILLSLIQKYFPATSRSKGVSSRSATLRDVLDVSLTCQKGGHDLGSCGTKRKRCMRRTDKSETKKKANPADHTSDYEMSEQNDETNEELEKSDEGKDKDPMSLHEKTSWIKEQLLGEIEKLGAMLPRNVLDELVDELGGPENVAEITERKGRVVQKNDGLVQYESRSETGVPLEKINLHEKERFMNGNKNIAIISETVSNGISLHADRRVKNQRTRLHIPLDLSLDSDRTLQQLGRTHRSNQVTAPEYVFLASDLAGERLFASVIANRLINLGAVARGSVFEMSGRFRFDFDTKDGRAALDAVMNAILGFEEPIVPPPVDYPGNFFKDLKVALISVGLICPSERNAKALTLDKDYTNISKFRNRILGIPIELQTKIFKYFTDTIAVIMTQSKKLKVFTLVIGYTKDRINSGVLASHAQ
ncbi:protein strawberry notch-like [Daphnia carinata]|uniref:protein strawberry notch-like n=1 Tax=Daphnia carinata TaxID=120202 RepID=UPI002869128B|nr:protein strawberry notch-like [Daphnia carinata]